MGRTGIGMVITTVRTLVTLVTGEINHTTGATVIRSQIVADIRLSHQITVTASYRDTMTDGNTVLVTERTKTDGNQLDRLHLDPNPSARKAA